MNTLETKGSSALEAREREIFHIEPAMEQEPQKLRVAGYARVSSDSADQLNSFSAQVSYYTKLIVENPDWELMEVYADEGVSGVSTAKRADFNRMLADCRKGKIDRIITKSTSRFARNTLDALESLRELKALGVTVLFEKEGIDTATVSGENLITLYALFAQEESMNISQNCKKGVRAKMRIGEYISTNAAYGYRLEGKEIQIYEPEAEVVRRIFTEYLAGRGIVEIAKGLIADGIPRKDGNPNWRHQTISDILRNERYIGDMLLQKNYSEDAMPYRKQRNRGELAQYYVTGSHEPIVEPLQFELANLLLRERGALIQTRSEGQYPYSRKIHCAACGATYKRRVTRGIAYWTCRRHNEAKDSCVSPRIPEESIDRAFFSLYNKLKESYTAILPPMLSALVRLQEQKNKTNPELLGLNQKIARLSEQNHVMNGLLSKNILDPALFIAQNDELTRKIRSLRQERARLLDEASEDDLIEKTEELMSLLAYGPSRIFEMDTALFTELVEKITPRPDNTLEFTLINSLVLTERMK